MIETQRALGGHPLRTLSAVTRAGTAVAGAVLCLAGGLLGAAGPTVRLALAMLCVALLIAFAQVVNDIVDVDLDRLTKPHRPLVSGAMTSASARMLAAVLAAGGIAAAAPLGPGFLAVAAVIATLSLAYSVRLKATVLWGSAVVALLASSPISFGAATNGELGRLPLAAQATALAFMFTFEVVKTGVDVDGDRAAGVRTIATAHGLVVTARVAVAWSVACALAAVMTALVAEHPATYVVLMIAGVAPFLVLAIIRLLAGAPTPPSLRRALAPLRIAWFGGAAALLAL